MIYAVMGVSGCGKTTVGKLLAQQLGVPFYDADDFHPKENIEKMKNGTPLNDQDRLPWLQALANHITEWNRDGGAVLACSALKESYRQILKDVDEWVYLSGSYEQIAGRLSDRNNHFFNPTLLQSQFDTLEIPDYGIHCPISDTPMQIVETVVAHQRN